MQMPSAGGQMVHSNYRAQQPGMDTGTRRLLMAAVALGGVLLAGTGGWALLGHRDTVVPVIEADTRPVRVKPDNAGGMQVAGSDEPAMGDLPGAAQAMAPAAEAPAPQVLRAQLQPPVPVVPPAAVLAVPAAPVLTLPAAPMLAVTAPPEAAHGLRPAARPAAAVAPAPAAPMPAVATPAAATPTAPAPAAPMPAVALPAVVSPAAAAPPIPAAGARPMVQLAAVDNEPAAQAEWQRLAKRMPDVLGGRRLVMQRAEHDGHAVWRVRTGGFADVADATGFCARVRAKGGACTIASF